VASGALSNNLSSGALSNKWLLLKLKLIYDRRSFGQSVLVSGSHLEPMTRFLFSVWRLRVSWCVAPSLTRGRVCNLLYNCFWSLPEQSLLGRSPAELTTIFYCLIWDSPNLDGQVPVFISPRNRVAQLYPRALGSLLSPLTTRRDYGGGILTRLHTGLCCPISLAYVTPGRTQ
jgi:hypothetical protein